MKKLRAPDGSRPLRVITLPLAAAETTWFSGSVLTGSGDVVALMAAAMLPASGARVVSAGPRGARQLPPSLPRS